VNYNLNLIKNKVYNKCSFQISAYANEPESKEYNACRFKLNEQNIVCRNAKTTPKKNGQFVTFWKRNKNKITEPLHENDPFDFFVINVSNESKIGQFVFPKSILINKGIISTNYKFGKRGFRVYPIWDITNTKQAKKTQQWQLNYFYEIDLNMDFIKVKTLYKAK